MIVLFSILIGIVGLDQLSKWLVVTYLKGNPSVPLWDGVLHLTYVENTGAAFGMLKDHRWVFLIFSSVAILALLYYLIRHKPTDRVTYYCLLAIVGGGIGNMIDRVALGYVVDFIDFRLIHFAVFNVADSFVTVGAILLMVHLLLQIIAESKQEKS